jgi:glycerophosphoryl diester phosphodiesterase
VVAALLPQGDNYPLDNPMKKEGDLPILIAHGGGNKEFPDNTLEAFYNAYGVDERVMMETDVSITKDGVLILSHDITLDSKTNVTGAIAD